MKRLRLLAILAISTLTPPKFGAAETLVIPGYEIHYSVFQSVFLSPQIASGYGIVRSGSQALINITVRRPSEQAAGDAQGAVVVGTVFDLVHRKALEFREIREQQAVYYLAPISFQNGETLYFTVDVQPDPDHGSHRPEFTKALYRD
jgi:hypothetical protein